jgi:6-pyruvoyltetrahydropterin/6-carboxytetrahydropterin synthase
LKVKFWFGTNDLDARNWVVDFGGLKNLKGWLEDTFDHKTLVAEDDPKRMYFKAMHQEGLLDMVEVPATGCEKFAEMIFEYAEQWIKDAGFGPRCTLLGVLVSEHEGNSAMYCNPNIGVEDDDDGGE